MSENTIKKLSISVMMYLDDLNLLDSLVETVGAASSNIIELGRERKDWEARKQLIEARKEMLHQLVSAAPVQFANHQGTYKDQMSESAQRFCSSFKPGINISVWTKPRTRAKSSMRLLQPWRPNHGIL